MSKTTDELDGLIKDFNDGLIDNLVGDNTLVFSAEDAEAARKAKEKRLKEAEEKTLIAKKDAQDLVRSAKELYSRTGDNVEYIKFKAGADANSLGKIIYQVEVAEDAIKTVMEAIKDGDNNTNLFKCLTDLQKTMIELLKTKNQYLTSIEDSFKQLTNDIEMSSAVEVESVNEPDAQTARIKGGRDLMKLINDAANKVEEERRLKQNNTEDGTDKQ